MFAIFYRENTFVSTVLIYLVWERRRVRSCAVLVYTKRKYSRVKRVSRWCDLKIVLSENKKRRRLRLFLIEPFCVFVRVNVVFANC